MSDVDTDSAWRMRADATRGGRPTIVFTGDLIETPSCTRGVQFDLGDIVTAEDPRAPAV